jgi:hypothetical protein
LAPSTQPSTASRTGRNLTAPARQQQALSANLPVPTCSQPAQTNSQVALTKALELNSRRRAVDFEFKMPSQPADCDPMLIILLADAPARACLLNKRRMPTLTCHPIATMPMPVFSAMSLKP